MRPPETLETGRLTLRKPLTDDAEHIFAKYAQDREVTKYLVWRPHTNLEATRSIVQSFIRAWEENEEFPWVIIRREDDELVGMIAIRVDHAHGVSAGYVLARQYWGNGYMTEALRAVVDWAFEQPGIYRVWAVHDVENTASGRVMEKAGMQYEGTLRKWTIHPNISDIPRDCRCYSIVK